MPYSSQVKSGVLKQFLPKNKIMFKLRSSIANQQLVAWQEIKDRDIPDLFQRYFERKVGISNQWHRMSAIRFGKVTSEFLEDIKKHKSLSLCMAVNNFDGKHAPFNLLMRVGDGADATFYQSEPIVQLSEDPLKPGLVYAAVHSPDKSVKVSENLELEGVRAALKNQYCANWMAVSSFEIPDLFTAFKPNQRGQDLVNLLYHEIKEYVKRHSEESHPPEPGSLAYAEETGAGIAFNPFNHCKVRGHWYNVNDYSLAVLLNNIERKGDHYLTINLGMNPGGVYFNKNQFSLVMEVLTRSPVKHTATIVNKWPVKGKDKDNILFSINLSSKELSESKKPRQLQIFAPNINLKNPPHRFWLNNKQIQGELVFTPNSTDGETESSDNVENYEFFEYTSVFDDYLFPCPPFCDPPPGAGDEPIFIV